MKPLLYAEFQHAVPGLQEHTTGECLTRGIEGLDTIAEALFLTPLSSFDRFSEYTDYAEELA